jgi:APA family basic amino acid/polyamine antiporter
MNLSSGLVDQFNFITDIAVFTNLVPYLFVSAAYVVILIERKMHIHSWVKTLVLGSLGVAFSIWAIYGSGRDTVFYGFLLLILGFPFYILMQWHKRNE